MIVDNDRNIIEIDKDVTAIMKERRMVKGNVFMVDNKVFVLGGNTNNDGEYFDLTLKKFDFKYIESYKLHSQN